MNDTRAVDAEHVTKRFRVRAGGRRRLPARRGLGRTWDEAGVGILDGVAGLIESPPLHSYLTGRQNLEGRALLDGGTPPGLLEEVLDAVEMSDRADLKVGG